MAREEIEKKQRRIEGAVYSALNTFQQTADWPQLRLAQMRQHLAEHIARELAFAPAADEADKQ
ncbi:hypothetical protein ACFYXD_34990 [Streptomyces platensis]|uniref:hypothetical protein n=1 Tax=Streptomyces platensis TaxID=58346 RepID=UPI0036ADDBB0